MIGRELTLVYKYIQSHYLNITRSEIDNFLKSQPSQLLMYDKPIVKAKPIQEEAPNLRWQVDLIDMTYVADSNKKYKYILNCIDVYSRFCWLRVLKDKSADTVRNAFIDIIEQTNVTPNIVQSDNGGEFMESFHDYLEQHNIKHIFNSTYSPNQNAIV